MRAAALASKATGTPITTHTQQGELGIEQQALMTGEGAAPHKLVIGHSDGSPDADYHRHIIAHGSYLGFDRWGYQDGQFGLPDEDKVASLVRIAQAGGIDHVVVSCDYVCCYAGSTWPLNHQPFADKESYSILHFVRNIVPKLRQAGISNEDIERLSIDNPRRYFSGEPIRTPSGAPI